MNNALRIISAVFYILTSIVISGLSTSDIQRLLRGAKTDITEKNCCCDLCGKPIPVIRQIPVISFLLSKGRCSMCGAKIPLLPTIQEGIIIAEAVVCGIITGFASYAVIINFGLYELFKIVMIVFNGRRSTEFAKSFIISVGLNICLFGLIYGFMAAVEFIDTLI